MRRRRTLVKDLSYFARTLGHLDELNIKLIKEVYSKGPRNLSLIARNLKAPKRTIHARFVKLKKEGLLSVHALPNFHKLGLVNILTFIDVKPEFSSSMIEVLKLHDYLFRLYSVLGYRNGIYAHFTIPVDKVKNFEKYIEELRKSRAVVNIDLSYVSNFHFFLPNFDFFDVKNKIWVFDVESYIADIQSGRFDRLRFDEPDSYRVNADKMDIVIIHWLQKDAMTRFASIARVRKVSRSLVKYHYDTHVAGKLVNQYIVYTPRFVPHTSNFFLLELEFEDLPGLEKFSFSLVNTHYAFFGSKEIRRHKIYMEIEAPVEDIDIAIPLLIEKLAKECGITNCTISMLRRSTYYWRPVAVELFSEDKAWKYREDMYFKALKMLPS
ncbi:MAG: hypothetical protein DRJ38_02670 [Thermoprotei archaeon]|nr:MAG: hypothetical protein DRJ38_02670 [Thermoprotei archaeon]